MVYRPLSPTPSPIKQRLLTGASVAVIALASAAVLAPAGAWAQAVEELSGTPGAPAVTAGAGGDGTLASGEAITNTTATNAVDAAALDVHGNATIRDVTITEDAQFFVLDGTNGGPGTLSFAATADDVFTIGSDDTFTISLGMQNSGAQSAEEIGAVSIVADQGINGGSPTTRGGTLVINSGQGADIQTTAFSVTFFGASDEAMLLTGLDISGANGEAPGGAAGAALNAAVGNDQNDTVDVTTVTFSGGNASDDTGGADGEAGGGTTSTITADTTIATLNVLGGDGGNNDAASAANNGGAGGAASLTITDTDGASVGTINVTAGAGGDDDAAGGGNGGAGGNATLVVATDSVTLTATSIAIAGGTAGADNGGAAGSGGAALVQLAGDVTATGGISLTDNGGSATFTLSGTSDQTVTGAITAGADGDGTITVNNTGGGGTAVNFASTVGASGARLGTFTLTNAELVEFDAAVFAGTITTAATTAEVQFDADVDATGINGTAGTTDLDFNANLTIGAGDLRLGDGGGTFAGNVSGTGNFRLDTGVTATFDGAAAQTVSTAITADTGGNGDITISNTSTPGVTFNSTIGTAGNRVGTITLNADANATFNDEVQASALTMTAGAGITINDDAAAATPMVVIIGNGGLTVTDGTINLGNEVGAGDIVFDLTTDAGEDINDAGATDGGTVINLAANFTSGTLTLIDDNDTIVAGDFDQFSVTDTALVDYTLTNAGQDITITAAARTTAETAALLGVSSDQAAALGSAVDAADTGSDDEALAAISTALNAGGTTATNAAEQVGVQGDTQGGASNVAFNAVGQQQIITGNRLASSRSGSQYGTSGFSSGDYYGGPQGGSYWIQGFGGIAMADGDSNAAGYDAGFGGFAVGVDGQFSEDVTVGFFGSYTHSYVEGDGVGQSELSANTYLIGAYSGFSTHNFYFDAFAAYAYADNESSRIVNVGGLDRTYVGDYGSSQVTLAATAGTPFEVGHSVYITPNAGLTWNHYDAEDYTETGTGALTATVDSETVNQLTGTVGARIHAVFDGVDRSGTVFIPELRLGVAFDLIDDDAVSTATFTGGGAAYQTTGTDTDDIGALLGLGLGFDNPDWSANLTYDADLRSDFHSHTARAEVRVKF